MKKNEYKNLFKMADEESVELCRMVNPYVSKRTKELLMSSCISFVERWRHVPLYRRAEYNGFSKVCILTINKNEYSKARRSLDTLDPVFRNRIVINLL